jgi:hypothetical protein
MLRLSVFLIVIALAAPAQEQHANSSPAAKFRISGTIVHGGSGQAVARADVAVGRVDKPGTLQSLTTAEDGRFAFENLTPGKYWLQAQARGCSVQMFDQHDQFSTAIAVGPDLQSDNLVFHLRPDATITGSIMDDQSEPIRDAQVMLFRGGTAYSTNSVQRVSQGGADDRGVYRFSHLPPGAYFVVVSAHPWYAEVGPRFRGSLGFVNLNASVDARRPEPPDPQFDVTYPVTYYPGVTDVSAATPITIKPGDHATADIAMNPVPALHLRISGADTSRGAGADLRQYVFGDYALDIPAQVNVFQKGGIEIGGIPPGQYSLTLRTWGKDPSAREKQIDISQDTDTDATGSPASASIIGIVQLDDGKPLSGRAFIRFSNRGPGQGFGAQVTQKGEFQVSGESVRPGSYEVEVFGLQNAVKKIVATGAEVTGQELEVGSGASVQLIVTLSQGVGRVDGTAVRDGKPMAGAMIILVPQEVEHNFTLFRRDQSDSDGTFSLYNVRPGKYRVIALANAWDLQWMNPAVLQPYLAGAQEINVAARGKYDLKVNVQ